MAFQDRKARRFCQVCATEGHQGEERARQVLINHNHGQARSIVLKHDSLRVEGISHMEINV